MTFSRHIFIPNKRDYIKGGKRPAVDCILCSILQSDSRVQQLLVWEDQLFAVSVNLYPYNPGHVLLFPRRHLHDPRELSAEEEQRLNALTRETMDILDELYEPAGYNIGCNIGDASGASIWHLHRHIVPRYPKELGFVDVTAGAKIIIEDPMVTMDRLKKRFAERL